MTNDKETVFWVVGGVMYVLGMIIFANHLMQTVWLFSFQGNRMIEQAAELLF